MKGEARRGLKAYQPSPPPPFIREGNRSRELLDLFVCYKCQEFRVLWIQHHLFEYCRSFYESDTFRKVLGFFTNHPLTSSGVILRPSSILASNRTHCQTCDREISAVAASSIKL